MEIFALLGGGACLLAFVAFMKYRKERMEMLDFIERYDEVLDHAYMRGGVDGASEILGFLARERSSSEFYMNTTNVYISSEILVWKNRKRLLSKGRGKITDFDARLITPYGD